MTEAIFGFLHSIGFTHPLHPAFTHIPMGMIMGAVVFRLTALLPRLKFLAKTGYHCIILGLIGVFPTVFTGYLDWQHTYGGTWEFLIIFKMILATALTAVLVIIAIMDDPELPGFDNKTLLYLLTLLLAIGLGFSGGELQYG
jgi:membrane-bound ClpP family serine protease